MNNAEKKTKDSKNLLKRITKEMEEALRKKGEDKGDKHGWCTAHIDLTSEEYTLMVENDLSDELISIYGDNKSIHCEFEENEFEEKYTLIVVFCVPSLLDVYYIRNKDKDMVVSVYDDSIILEHEEIPCNCKYLEQNDAFPANDKDIVSFVNNLEDNICWKDGLKEEDKIFTKDTEILYKTKLYLYEDC